MTTTRCWGCFETQTDPCPCGFQQGDRTSSLYLPYGALLDGRYEVGRELGDPGGFGIVYLGWDRRLECKVAIKEYLPRGQAARSADGLTISINASGSFHAGLESFIKEAHHLAKLKHPNVVHVSDSFKANGTGYLVMDYYQGKTLARYARERGGKLDEATLLRLMMPLIDGLIT